MKVRHYFNLTKPGIVFSNTLAAIAGFFLAASQVSPNILTFLSVVIGTALVIASACVINNFIDRHIDTKMERTKKREIPSGIISWKSAVAYGVVLGVVGFVILILGTNLLTFVLGMVAYIFYVAVYGYFKRKSEHGTLVGSISGALPPVAGYTALTNHLDLGALLLFLLFVTWQMGHFYSIAIYRRRDYKAAGIPLLTVTRGVKPAKEQIVLYIIGFVIVSVMFFLSGYLGVAALGLLVLSGLWWLSQAVKLLKTKEEESERKQARKLFGTSILVLFVLCLAVAVGGFIV